MDRGPFDPDETDDFDPVEELSVGPGERYAEESENPDLGPSIPKAPQPPDPTAGDGDVDPKLEVRFWELVLVFNVALLATSVGIMFVVFQGDVALGGRLLLVGLVAFVGGYVVYRRVMRNLSNEEADDGGADPDAGVDDRNR